MTWERQPEEFEGNYTFVGRILVTKAVNDRLVANEIAEIILNLRAFINEKTAVDYLQVFANKVTGKRIYMIDNLTETERKDPTLLHEEREKHDFSVMLFDYEY